MDSGHFLMVEVAAWGRARWSRWGQEGGGVLRGILSFFGLRNFAHFLNSYVSILYFVMSLTFIASFITCKILQISRFYRGSDPYFQMSTIHFHFEFPHVQNGLFPFPVNLTFLWNVFPSTCNQSGNRGVSHSFPSLPALRCSFVQ